MAYTSQIIQQATALLDRRRAAHQAQQRRVRAQVYEALPEVKQIDARLRAGMLALTAAAFDHGTDPAPRVAEIRQQNQALQQRRRQVLSQGGFAPDCLDDAPLCPKCGDRGWRGSEMCDCLRQLCAREQIKSLSSLLELGDQRFETFSLGWYSTEYDDELGMSHRENMRMVEQICRSYAEKFGKYQVRNLFLTGAPGLGKTFLSACIARVVSEKGFSVVYDTAVAIFTNFEDAKFGRGEEADAAVERYLSCDLLILDDLGSELTSSMSQSALYTLINSRLMADRHTVISSNLSLDDVRRRYQPMIASRLEGEYRELSFVGQDIRVLRKNAAT